MTTKATCSLFALALVAVALSYITYPTLPLAGEYIYAAPEELAKPVELKFAMKELSEYRGVLSPDVFNKLKEHKCK